MRERIAEGGKMNGCINCGHKYNDVECFRCRRNDDIDKSPSEWVPKLYTNGDIVRTKTNEELNEWFWWMLKYVRGYTDSRVALIDWLNQKVKQ